MIYLAQVISELLQVSLDHIKDMIDANTIIGTALHQEKITIIPISRVSVGFVSGGSDFKTMSSKEDSLFGGGTGGGIVIKPVAFIVIKGDEVSLLSINDDTHIAEKIIDLIPKSIDKVKSLFDNNVGVSKV